MPLSVISYVRPWPRIFEGVVMRLQWVIVIFLFVLQGAVASAMAQSSALRIACTGDSVGAEVFVNGQFKGECPLDIQVAAGSFKIVAKKKVDAERERVFEQEFRIGDGVAKKVEVQLSEAQYSTDYLAKNRVQGQPGKIFRDCPECPEMVILPPGLFTMGSPASGPDRRTNEGPQHKVSIAYALAVGKYEVSFAEWDACVATGGCSHKPKDEGWGRGRRPVIHVSWQDAQQYVQWLSNKTGKPYRLLTEAEWEYAYRAGTTTPFYTGSCINPDQANYEGNYDYNNCGAKTGEYREKTIEVGSFKANAFGLHDMAGNVWEWVQDCYNHSYAGAPGDGKAWTGGECKSRVLRGGSWNYFPYFLRAAVRIKNAPVNRGNFFGFRVAR